MNASQDRWNVAWICAFVVLSFQTAILLFVVPLLQSHKSVFVLGSIVAGVGIYVSIFRLGTWIYDHFVWRWVHPSLVIDGTWEHTFTTHDGVVRKGRTNIRQTAFAIEIWGENYDADGELIKSTWRATSVWLSSHTLRFTYDGERQGNDAVATKSGIVTANLDGKKPPLKLTGFYYDANPAPGTGQVTWIKLVNAASRGEVEARASSVVD